MNYQPNAQNTAWIGERLKRLKDLCALGMSASQIAADIGLSRNAVIGKIHRLRGKGENLSLSYTQLRLSDKERRERYNARQERLKAKRGWQIKIRLRPSEIPIEAFNKEMPNRVRLLDVEKHHCRWPIGDPTKDFWFCGNDKVMSELPYCGYHCRMVYEKR